MFMAKWTTEGIRVDEMMNEFGSGNTEQGMIVLAKLLTGLSYREYDMTEAQKRAVYNNSSRLRKTMAEKGILRKFESQYYAPGVQNIMRNMPALAREK